MRDRSLGYVDGAQVSVAATALSRPWVGPALLIAVCLLPILLYLPFLGAPLERDEGVYATVAAGMLHDKVPYQDLFDNKPPLVYGWYALSFLTLGEDPAAPRIFAAALLSLTTFAVFAYSRLIMPRPAAYVAAALFGLSTGLPFVSLHANTEAFMLLPLVTSLLAFTVGLRKERLVWFVIAGASCGLAVITKQVAIWNMAALVAAAFWWRWRAGDRGWRMCLPGLSVLAAGFTIIAGAATVFAGLGALDDFVYANISYNYRYVAFVSSAERVLVERSVLSWAFFLALAAPLVAAAGLGMLRLLRVRRSFWHVSLFLWTLATALGVSTGGRFFPHYFLEFMPVLSVLAAIVVYDHFSARSRRPARAPATIVAGLLIATTLTTTGLLYLAPEATMRRFSMKTYHQKEWEQQIPALADFITERTRPDERIFNYGRESQIYLYADRLPAAPFFYDWVHHYDASTIRTTIDSLRTEPPRYIVDTVQPPLLKESDRSPEFDAFLRESYELMGHVYFADVYRLRDQPRPAIPRE